MTVRELAKELSLTVKAGEDGLDCDVSGCYIGDLLSLAMSSIKEANVWITIQTSVNIVAVSVLTEGACVILCSSQEPDENAKKKADIEGVPLLTSDKQAYELAAALSKLGI